MRRKISIIFFSIIIVISMIALAACSDGDADKTSNEISDNKTAAVDAESKNLADVDKTPTAEDISKSSKTETSRTNSQKKSSSPKPKGSNAGKKWVEPVYETVYHPAVTHEEKAGIDYYTCQCGQTFSNSAEWQAHRPKPCNGLHTYAEPHILYRTVIDEEAWTEKVLVKEGHWE